MPSSLSCCSEQETTRCQLQRVALEACSISFCGPSVYEVTVLALRAAPGLSPSTHEKFLVIMVVVLNDRTGLVLLFFAKDLLHVGIAAPIVDWRRARHGTDRGLH
jgi:hypothetical protein